MTFCNELKSDCRITIATPVFNRADCIASCIESVVNQSSPPYEYILVDDGSTDNTCEIIQRYVDSFDWIFLYRNDINKGVNTTRNKCIEFASGDYILWLDSDDELSNDAIVNIYNSISPDDFLNYKHFLFLVSDRVFELNKDSNFMFERNLIYFKQWLSGEIAGDFAHLMSTDLLRMYPFYENFKASEGLNFLRIHKHTQVQLFVNILVINRDRNRSDSLSNNGFLTNRSNILEKYNYLFFFIKEFDDDLVLLDKHVYYFALFQVLILGVALRKNSNTKNLIKKRHNFVRALLFLTNNSFFEHFCFYLILGFSKIKNIKLNLL